MKKIKVEQLTKEALQNLAKYYLMKEEKTVEQKALIHGIHRL